MKNQLEIIELNEPLNISPRSNPRSRSLRAVVITSNRAKFNEIQTLLGDGYGMDVKRFDVNSRLSLSSQCQVIMQTAEFTPHFILREQSLLTHKDSSQDLTSLSMDELTQFDLEAVIHTSTLQVYKPQWQDSDEGKRLSHFTKRDYCSQTEGFIDFARQVECVKGFGWDAIFVNAASNLTNEEFFQRYDKQSARQHCASLFIIEYLRYKALVSLKHHDIAVTKPIDFGKRYIDVTQFIKADPYLSNEKVNQWGIANLRNAMVNGGLFFKAAWSRSVKNYFSPPFSGLPLTAKQGPVEETIFATHDMLHHAVPDLVCDAEHSRFGFFVYSAWRMLSEACTLVMADMFYADSLILTGVNRDLVDKRIYPLFEAIKQVHQIDESQPLTKEQQLAFIKKLLFANMRYALHGDDSQWRQLLQQADGSIIAEHQQRLEAYKNHFAKFFIGDNAWTRANYDNMYAKSEELNGWIHSVGKESFRRSGIPLLTDIMQQLEDTGVDLNDYQQVSAAVFELVFTTRIAVNLQQDDIPFDDASTIQSRAFRRYLMGQVSLFSRYPTPINAGDIKESIIKRIKSPEPFTNQEQDDICNNLKRYILLIEGMGLMSHAQAKNAIDCVAVFPPVYISYTEMQRKFATIQACVQQRIEAFAMTEKDNNNYPGTFFTDKKQTQYQVSLVKRAASLEGDTSRCQA